jgi:hypothetical protein
MSISHQFERRSTVSVIKSARKSSMNYQKDLSKVKEGKDGKGKPWWNRY